MMNRLTASIGTAVNNPSTNLVYGSPALELTEQDLIDHATQQLHRAVETCRKGLLVFAENKSGAVNGSQHEFGVEHLMMAPLTWQESMTRFRGTMGRTAEAGNNIAQFSNLRVDFISMEVTRYGHPVALTALEFKALKFFVSHPSRVITRREMLEHVWGYKCYPTTRTVDNLLLKLRRKLEPEPADPIHFLTVHGIGYKFKP